MLTCAKRLIQNVNKLSVFPNHETAKIINKETQYQACINKKVQLKNTSDNQSEVQQSATDTTRTSIQASVNENSKKLMIDLM